MASKKPDVSFSHFGMWVENLPRMVRFYTGLLGYVVSDRGPLNTPTGRHPFAFLTRDAAEHQGTMRHGLVAGDPQTTLHRRRRRHTP